jgi:hypothetical protein
MACKRASSPRVHLGHRASRPSCSFPNRGVRNALAKSRFRGRPLARRASRTPLEKDSGTRAVAQLRRARIASAEPGPRKQSFRLRSARGWICRLAGCPRVYGFCPLPPFVRAVARTCTRAVRSLHRGLPVRLQTRDLKAFRAGKLRGPPRPVPRREDHRGALRIGTGRLR